MLNKIRLFICLFIYIFIAQTIFSFNIDKKVNDNNNNNFFISSHYDTPKYIIVGIIGIAAYEGTESRLGLVTWKSLEAGAISLIITEGLKKTTGRVRPRSSDNPNEWGTGGTSFPSGHVSITTAMVTPIILEYKNDYPLVHLFWIFPIQQMVGRVKTKAHWQSDVVAGALVGYASGYWVYKRKTPLIFYFTEDKVVMGFKYIF